MKLLVAVLAHREKAELFARQLDWFNSYDPNLWPKFIIDTTQGLDAGRSSIVDRARAMGAERLVMMDGDCIPEASARDVVSVANQDISRGYAGVISPTRGFKGELLVHAVGKQFASPMEVPTNHLFEISWGGLGFGVYDVEQLGKLRVLGAGEFTDGTGGKVTRPLYCEGKGSGEDRSFCDNLRASTGKPLGCDPRLLVQHAKLQPVLSWRPELLKFLETRDRLTAKGPPR